MKPKAQTQKPRSASKDKNTQKRSLTQIAKGAEEFEKMLLDINIKKPKTPFNFFVMEIKEKHNLTMNITEIASKYKEKYLNLTNAERKRYDKMAEEDKLRYEVHMQMVRKFILDKPFKEKATARSIYIEEQAAEARESEDCTEEDVNEKIENAKYYWDEKMNPEQKKEYEEKLEKHKEFYEDLRKTRRNPSAYDLYSQDQRNQGKEKDVTYTFAELGEKWSNLSDRVKGKYEKYAKQTAEENKKLRHIYELAYGIKPKNPIGAQKFYIQHLKENGEYTKLNEARKKWENLSEEEKETYLKMAKREKIAFILKKREYESKNKKPRAPSAMNLFMKDLSGTDSKNFSEKGFFNYAYQKWSRLSADEKQKYKDKSDAIKKEMREEEKEKSKLDDIKKPKKALSAYNIYVGERSIDIKKKHPDKPQTEIFKQAAKEYENLSLKEKEKFEKKAEKDKERYEKEFAGYEEEKRGLEEKMEIKKEKSKSKMKNNRGRMKSKSRNDDDSEDVKSEYESDKKSRKRKNKNESGNESDTSRRSNSKKARKPNSKGKKKN